MKKKWFRLDNAALIFPAIMTKKWNNCFRVSATFKDPIDPGCLSQALKDMKPRFPSFFVRLRRGFFWDYLEEIEGDLPIQEEYAYPLTFMNRSELRKHCIRVLYYQNRISVEIFHSVTDGSGGVIFLKNLAACYVRLRYQVQVPLENDLVDLQESPKPEELMDCFPTHSGKYPARQQEFPAYHRKIEAEPDGFKHLITGIVPTDKLLEVAHRYHTTATCLLSAVMAMSMDAIQRKEVPEKKWKPVMITVAINLRKQFPAKTFRNFALAANIGIDPKDGYYTLPQMVSQMTHQLKAEVVPQKMTSRIAANVLPQKMLIVRIMPKFIKYFVMRAVYRRVGEAGGCLNISNLGNVELPEVMSNYLTRFEFIIGVQTSYPNNCSVASYNGKTFINMIRWTKDATLERKFFSALVELGIPVEIESNKR